MSSPDVSAGRPVKEQQAKMINGFQNISPGEVVNIEAIEQCRCDNLQTDRDGNANKKGLVMTEKGSMYWENRDAIAVDKYLGDEGPAITYLLTYSFGGWSMHDRDNFDITPSYYMRRAGMQRRKQQWDEDEDQAAQETETAKTGQKSKTHPTQKLNAAQKKGEDEDEDADYEGSE
ncbi:hypothetical protein DDE82_003956 [Stemphylium lycopersici]|nr:hypothetical protein DDE82_003956 [Stemphylium lycopersici]